MTCGLFDPLQREVIKCLSRTRLPVEEFSSRVSQLLDLALDPLPPCHEHSRVLLRDLILADNPAVSSTVQELVRLRREVLEGECLSLESQVHALQEKEDRLQSELRSLNLLRTLQDLQGDPRVLVYESILATRAALDQTWQEVKNLKREIEAAAASLAGERHG